MQKTVQILSAKRYDFVNDSGERINGTCITCVYDSSSKITDNQLGVDVVRFNTKSDIFGSLSSVPAYYDIDFNLSFTPDGRAKLVPVSVTLKK